MSRFVSLATLETKIDLISNPLKNEVHVRNNYQTASSSFSRCCTLVVWAPDDLPGMPRNQWSAMMQFHVKKILNSLEITIRRLQGSCK